MPLNEAIGVAAHANTAPILDVGSRNGVTQTTTLDNGLRVASQASFGQYCTVGGEEGCTLQCYDSLCVAGLPSKTFFPNDIHVVTNI